VNIPPLQLKVNLPLLQVEFDQIQTDERSQHSAELFIDKDTLRLVVALPALGIAHSCRAMSPIRGPLASVMMSSTALTLSNLITKPSAMAAVPFNLGMPRTRERANLALAPEQW